MLYFTRMTDEALESPEDYSHVHELEVERYHKNEQGIRQTSHDVFSSMAKAQQKRLSIPRTKEFTRKDVIEALADSFELIGGIPRMAAWAHENPTKFYELYARLAPSENNNTHLHDGLITIQGALQPSPLDGPTYTNTIDHNEASPLQGAITREMEKTNDQG